MSWLDTLNLTFAQNVVINYFGETAFDIFDVFPRLNVQKDAGYIVGYDKDTLLDIGNPEDYTIMGSVEAPEITSKAIRKDYVCLRRSAKILVDQDRVENTSTPYAAIKDATAQLKDSLGRILIKNFVSKVFNTSVWNNVKAGGTTTAQDFIAWNQSTSDPIKDFDNFNSDLVLSKTGYKCNQLVVTNDVFVALKHNDSIKGLLPATDTKILTEDKLANLFGVKKFTVVDTIDINGFMVQNMALMLYTTDAPSQTTPSAGYICVSRNEGTKKSKYVGVRLYKQPEKNQSLAIEGTFKIDPVITCPDLGVLLTNVLA